MDVEPLTTNAISSASTFFGARANGVYYALMKASSSSYNVYWEYNTLYSNIWTVSNVNDYAKRRTVEANGAIAVFDETTKSYDEQTFQLDYPLFLLASNEAGTMNYPLLAKLYSCKIYDNGTLIRD